MKFIIILFVIASIAGNQAFAQIADSAIISSSVSAWERMQMKMDKIAESRAYQMTFIGVPLIAGGLIVKNENDKFRELRNSFTPSFHHHYDDYLQYAPAALMLGLKISGVKGRSSWARMLTSDAFSAILMASSINLIKSTTDVLRPDGSTHNSFPSGHTATAFMAASMLHKEYGLTRSPWYSIAGYTIATATAISRQLNNRHWLSDIMVGAGIGILSTELGYLFADLIFKDKGITHDYLSFNNTDRNTPPSFFGYYLGFSIVPGLDITHKDIKLDTSTGSSAGFEGAYFFNPYLGIGGRLRIANIPISIDNASYFSYHYLASLTKNIQPAPTDILSMGTGSYFSYPFTNRWLVGSKLLVDVQYSSGTNIKAIYREQPDEQLKSEDIVNIGKYHSVGIGTGISTTYIAKQNLSVRFFMDYDLIPTHFSFSIHHEEGTDTYKSNQSIHVLTVGTSINIQF